MIDYLFFIDNKNSWKQMCGKNGTPGPAEERVNWQFQKQLLKNPLRGFGVLLILNGNIQHKLYR